MLLAWYESLVVLLLGYQRYTRHLDPKKKSLPIPYLPYPLCLCCLFLLSVGMCIVVDTCPCPAVDQNKKCTARSNGKDTRPAVAQATSPTTALLYTRDRIYSVSSTSLGLGISAHASPCQRYDWSVGWITSLDWSPISARSRCAPPLPVRVKKKIKGRSKRTIFLRAYTGKKKMHPYYLDFFFAFILVCRHFFFLQAP